MGFFLKKLLCIQVVFCQELTEYFSLLSIPDLYSEAL